MSELDADCIAPRIPQAQQGLQVALDFHRCRRNPQRESGEISGKIIRMYLTEFEKLIYSPDVGGPSFAGDSPDGPGLPKR
jgi:hypothetical protein